MLIYLNGSKNPNFQAHKKNLTQKIMTFAVIFGGQLNRKRRNLMYTPTDIFTNYVQEKYFFNFYSRQV